MLVVGKEEGSGQGRCAQDFLLHRYVKEDGINRTPSALFGFVYAFPGKGFVRDTNKLSLKSQRAEVVLQVHHHRCYFFYACFSSYLSHNEGFLFSFLED